MAGERTVPGFGADDQTPVFVISVAAELAGMHAQTLRQYDRIGLVIPSRTRGGGRRYSAHDVARLREVQRLSQEEGVSLAGIQRILELENENAALRARLAEVRQEAATLRAMADPQNRHRFFAVGPAGEAVVLRPGQRPRRSADGQALVVWRPTPRH